MNRFPLSPLSLPELLAGLPGPAVTALFDRWLEITLPAGEIIHRPGQPGEMLYIVGSGCVLIEREEKSHEQNGTWTLGPGAVLGEMPTYGYSLAGCRVTTVGETHLRIMSRVAVDHLRRRFPIIATRLPRRS